MKSSGSENPDPTIELFLTDPYTYPHSKRPDPRISSFPNTVQIVLAQCQIFPELRSIFSGQTMQFFKVWTGNISMGTALGRDLFTAHNV
jgi:hypothetical protein